MPAQRLRRATRDAFDNLIDAALQEAVDLVVIAGDLFDGDWKDMSTGLYFTRAMGRLAQAGIQVYLLKGNHDADSVVTKSLPLPDTVKLFSSRTVQTFELPELGIALHGRSFPTAHVHEDLTESYPPPVAGAFNIGVLHTSVGGYAQHEAYAPCTVQGLVSKGYDYWALGHVHEREVLSQDPWIVFPGNLQGRHAREIGTKGATLVDVTDGHVMSAKHLPLDVVRWHRVEVDCAGAASTESVHVRIRDALTRIQVDARERSVVARVVLTGATSIAGELSDRRGVLRDEIRALAAHVAADLWIEKVVIETSLSVEASLSGVEYAASMLDEALGDPDLEVLLAENLKPFLDAVPPDACEVGGLHAAAREKRWSELLTAASVALRERLSTGGA
jgi:DNA repair exonuclease SbcCD nuclease subunit